MGSDCQDDRQKVNKNTVLETAFKIYKNSKQVNLLKRIIMTNSKQLM